MGPPHVLLQVVAKAMEEAGLGELVVEERKADRLQRLQDEWAKEHNAALAPTLTRKNRTVEEDAVAGAKSELIWAGSAPRLCTPARRQLRDPLFAAYPFVPGSASADHSRSLARHPPPIRLSPLTQVFVPNLMQ